MTRDKQRALDKLSMVFLTALNDRDWTALHGVWVLADSDPDIEDMLYDLATEWDRPVPSEACWTAPGDRV